MIFFKQLQFPDGHYLTVDWTALILLTF